MAILYSSTRGGEKNVTASEAILKGLACDGGLFVPDHIPVIEGNLQDWKEYSYQQVAYEIMKLYLTDFTKEEFIIRLNEVLSTADINQVKADVLPFVRNPKELDIWSNEYFIQLSKLIRFL